MNPYLENRNRVEREAWGNWGRTLTHVEKQLCDEMYNRSIKEPPLWRRILAILTP